MESVLGPISTEKLPSQIARSSSSIAPAISPFQHCFNATAEATLSPASSPSVDNSTAPQSLCRADLGFVCLSLCAAAPHMSEQCLKSWCRGMRARRKGDKEAIDRFVNVARYFLYSILHSLYCVPQLMLVLTDTH